MITTTGSDSVLPTLDDQTGLLPLGRFGASFNEIKAQYVDDPRFAGSTTRAEIWQDFESATEGIRSIVPVVCVWVGGSFLTDKVDPDDIDLVYWCEDVLVNQVDDPKGRLILEMFANNQVRPATGLRVDTRYCLWHVFPEADRAESVEHQSYALSRGYWDDFWMRKRTGTKEADPKRPDALPQRGYFEVILDGFHEL